MIKFVSRSCCEIFPRVCNLPVWDRISHLLLSNKPPSNLLVLNRVIHSFSFCGLAGSSAAGLTWDLSDTAGQVSSPFMWTLALKVAIPGLSMTER